MCGPAAGECRAAAAGRGRVWVRASTTSAAEWDAFAQRCGASFRCSYRGAAAWQWEANGWHRLLRLELFDGPGAAGRKVGQCAVGLGRRRHAFADGLQLLPVHGDLWADGLSAVVAHVGPGDYVYGSEWSLEPPRQFTLDLLAGVTVGHVRPACLQVIDFARWDTWESYATAVSANVRRNVRRAAEDVAGLAVVDGVGPKTGRLYLNALALRRAMFRRKGVARPIIPSAARSVGRLLSMRTHTRVSYLLRGGRLASYYVGIHYGGTFCYLEGASAADAGGAGWYLLMATIRRAYEQSGGRGRFVMGSDNDPGPGDDAWEGLRRSRRQCRAEAVPTSVVEFTYADAS